MGPDGIWTYTYDVEGRLVGVQHGVDTWVYTPITASVNT